MTWVRKGVGWSARSPRAVPNNGLEDGKTRGLDQSRFRRARPFRRDRRGIRFTWASQEVAMRESWEILIAGPPDAASSVLLLPGGEALPWSAFPSAARGEDSAERDAVVEGEVGLPVLMGLATSG